MRHPIQRWKPWLNDYGGRRCARRNRHIEQPAASRPEPVPSMKRSPMGDKSERHGAVGATVGAPEERFWPVLL